uniref:Uncharacterized protein n=1 Tax=Amphimedon queenslandica TaxID=400682 RepID=A0A1X7U029_AMPQE
MATKRDIARLLNEVLESDYIASVLGDYFCDETSATDYEAVEDIEEENEEGTEEEKETKIVIKILMHHCLILSWLWTYKYQILI